MGFCRWFRRSRRPVHPFRPAVVVLEDRTVPADLGGLLGLVSPSGPATHLQVIVPESTRAGRTFDVFVEALDATNHPAGGYTGSVTLSLGTPDAGAKVPAVYQFGANDHGLHEFRVALSLTAPQTITATDSANALSASAVTNAAARVATRVVVETPPTAATGVPTPVEVEVLDQAGQVMGNFTGPVTVSSTDTTATGAPSRRTAAASLPITYNFQARDHGAHAFLVTFNAAVTGATPATVTAATGSPALTGTSQLTLYPPTTVTHLGLSALPLTLAGASVPVVVEALNASNQVVTGYTGKVGFSITEVLIPNYQQLLGGFIGTTGFLSFGRPATVRATKGGPAITSYQFTAGDKGKHTFWLTFPASGTQSLAVVDSASNLSATACVQVYPAGPGGEPII
jgi:hypothetical protein